jgi:peptidoglycan/LPS O-acetylase OafA/YrhL
VSGLRFEVAAAWAMGVVLPLLEALRRRTNFESPAFYVDDFLAGALLLWAADSARRRHPKARLRLAGAWGVLSGGLYGSFFGQLEDWRAVDVGGQSGLVVVAIKGVLYAISIAAFVCALRRERLDAQAPGR